ncbi:DUF4817 domain-containing protein [Trichonephila clavipes]|nr:DUF4817 domain-containing protein [Trichonephila clavipes]
MVTQILIRPLLCYRKKHDFVCKGNVVQFSCPCPLFDALLQNQALEVWKQRFVEWAQNEIAFVPDFHKRILFSDEAHFWLNGYVNKQNCRIWSEANPQVYVETPLHPETLTVWCALWAGGIIGPYFFKNDGGHNVTVNGDRYRAMITNFFIPELNNHDVQQLWFQQDGATCHTARATIDLLKDTFGDRLISRFGPVNWPPRSCDLTPLDYFLWSYVKSLVYADKPQTLDYLEDNIRRVIADIRPQMLEKVIENWTSRLDYIRASRGSPMPEIIFIIKVACTLQAMTENESSFSVDQQRVSTRVFFKSGESRSQSSYAGDGLSCPGRSIRFSSNKPLDSLNRYLKAEDSWLLCHEFEPSTAADHCTLNLSKLKCPPIGVIWNLEKGMPALVSSSSLKNGSNYEVCHQ